MKAKRASDLIIITPRPLSLMFKLSFIGYICAVSEWHAWLHLCILEDMSLVDYKKTLNTIIYAHDLTTTRYDRTGLLEPRPREDTITRKGTANNKRGTMTRRDKKERMTDRPTKAQKTNRNTDRNAPKPGNKKKKTRKKSSNYVKDSMNRPWVI